MMKITGMKVNHKENPIGYDFPYLRFDWMTEEAEGKEAAWVQVEVREVSVDGSTRQVYDSGQTLPDAAGGLTADFQTAPETRYECQVTVCTYTGKTVCGRADRGRAGRASLYGGGDPWIYRS